MFQVPTEVTSAHGQPKNYWGARARLTYSGPVPYEILEEIYEPALDKHPMLKDWLESVGLTWVNRNASWIKNKEILKKSDYMFSIVMRRDEEFLDLGAWRYDIPLLLRYEIDTLPEKVVWEGTEPPPKPGDMIVTTEFGSGTVLDYYVEQEKHLGVRLLLDNPAVGNRVFTRPWGCVRGTGVEHDHRSKHV